MVDENVVYLKYSYWDDYGYCTTFTAYLKNEEIGVVKIGCKSLSSRVPQGLSVNGFSSYSISSLIPLDMELDRLEDDLFSLGQDINYYQKINELFPDDNDEYLSKMNDLASSYESFKSLYDKREPCLISSLMRNLHYSNVEQFHRITKGEAELTDYRFSFNYLNEKIDIDVTPNSRPPSNIHVLIGRNGVGKTWLLHNMVISLLENSNINVELDRSEKYSISNDFTISCPKDSFAGIIGLSFSVFDDALAIDIKSEKDVDIKQVDDFRKKYKYIGLVDKTQRNGKIKTKSVDDLSFEFHKTLKKIKKSKHKIAIYLETCTYLNSDPMFSDNQFIDVLKSFLLKKDSSVDAHEELLKQDIMIPEIEKYFKKLSSGHMIIILSLTLLSESIYEKTIVLIDEPETHLHPPLLSTYIRALSYLLIKKNAVAIIATHSPIVLQEVPQMCVNKIDRQGKYMQFKNVETQTFATSIDTLTREVFGLEVVKTGFYQLIEKELGRNFDDSYEKFEGNLGFLGQILMQSLLKKRESDEKN
ncbi:hypothetical protein J42TS3_19490 [Paenibacillus vini]|uniref:ATPase AAA-type core domain-containing protein n=1 Tax=Paenibacillus vini TaxID=1476024 RepID=A0ABQ4MAB6_9BACL|nr:hypothetical protein J42TS3_19490 [Paenibacillus vini]